MLKAIWVGMSAALIAGCASVVAPPSALSPSALAAVPSGTANIGPDKAEIRFSVSPLGLGRVDGQFEGFEASLTIENAADGAALITANVDTTSVSMKNSQYQDMVTSPAWFDVENFPTAIYSGELSGWDGDGVGTMVGEMTIKGVTRTEEMELRLTCDELTNCPEGALGFEGRLDLSRSAYGMSSLRGVVSDNVTLVVRGQIDLSER